MPRKTLRTSARTIAVALLLSLALVASHQPAQAARVFAFNQNLARIDEVCRDGANITAANNSSTGGAHTGEGNKITFSAWDANTNTAVAVAATLTMLFHPAPDYYNRHVYETGRLSWMNPLTPGTLVTISAVFNDAALSGPFTVADCWLNPTSALGFAYQGRLVNGGNAANGPHDFIFTLYDAAEGGNMLGDPIQSNSVNIVDGQFVTWLNFSHAAFHGGAVWLDIEVRPAGGSYTKLSPRQPIGPAPYALYALNIPEHSHLGETWYGNDPLVIKGTFETFDFGLTVQDMGSANGIHASVVNGNAVNADNNSKYAAIYAQNNAAGAAIVGHSKSGPGGRFSTLYGSDLLVAQQLVADSDQYYDRFRVQSNGDVRADGTYFSGTGGYYTGSADLAEMLPAAENLEPGDVLVIDAGGHLARSTLPNAANVAGVYSTQPGFVGGYGVAEEPPAALSGSRTGPDLSGADRPAANVASAEAAEAALNAGKVPLAIAGVVPVKVNTENGAIQPGDMLTTSSQPGYAMKAMPIDVGGVSIARPGTILGKALEPLGVEAGTGVIRVLIVLQ
jgi:hypothetical protein